MSALAKVLAIAAILSVSLYAARYAAADFFYERAKRSYDSLDISKLQYASELKELKQDVDRSLMLRRGSANALDFKADLQYQSWWLSPDGQYLQDSDLLQNAVTLHMEAQNYRKDWSFSAARLALIYSNQRRLDKRFARWFAQAHRLGLYETTIARSLMVVGLNNWAQLSEAQKRMTQDFVAASIEQKANSPTMMRSVLDSYQLRDVVCASLLNTTRKTKVCQD